jgi:O-antigen/teichoic acid export membrane protein
MAIAAQVAPLAAAAALSLTIARLYGPARTGVMSLVMNLADVALQVFTLGLSSGITYLISRREWPLRSARRAMTSTATVLGASGAIAALVFYELTRDSIFKGVPPALVVISLTSLPFAISWSFVAAAALGRDRYEAYATFEISYSIVLVVVGVSLAIAFGLTGAVIGFTTANVATAIIATLWVRREQTRDSGSAHDRTDDGTQLRRAARFGLQSWSANLLQLLNYRLDLFILSAVAARSAVGVYAIAVSVTGLGWILPNALQTVLFPRVASLDASADAGQISLESSDAAAARAVRHAVFMMGPTASVLVVLVVLVPVIYGSGFEQSMTLGFILIPGVAALGLAKVLSAVFSGRGFPRYALYTTAISVPITLALYLALIPPLDATGAAVASTLSYFVTTAVSVFYFERATAIPLRTALVPLRSDLVDYVHAIRLARARFTRA